MSQLKYDEIVHSYISICNQAIDLHRERFPFYQIWNAAEISSKGIITKLKLHDVVPNLLYHIHVKHDEMSLISDRAVKDHDIEWNVPLSYLSKIVELPEKYIQNPVLMDWGWFIDRP